MCSIWMSMSQGRSTFFSVFFVVLFFSIALSSKGLSYASAPCRLAAASRAIDMTPAWKLVL
jgi:hypothetical protein